MLHFGWDNWNLATTEASSELKGIIEKDNDPKIQLTSASYADNFSYQ